MEDDFFVIGDWVRRKYSSGTMGQIVSKKGEYLLTVWWGWDSGTRTRGKPIGNSYSVPYPYKRQSLLLCNEKGEVLE